MSKSSLLPLVLLLAAPTLTAKQKVEIPDVITAATYVMVTTYDGECSAPTSYLKTARRWPRCNRKSRNGDATSWSIQPTSPT